MATEKSVGPDILFEIPFLSSSPASENLRLRKVPKKLEAQPVFLCVRPQFPHTHQIRPECGTGGFVEPF